MPTTPLERWIDNNVKCTKCGIRGVGNCHCWDRKPKKVKKSIKKT